MGQEDMVEPIGIGRKTPETVSNNILSKKQLEAAIDHVVHNVADMVSHTLGPFGGNTLIVEPYPNVPVNPSKDGYRVIQSIRYDDVTFNAIFGILRDLAARMNMDVGDSTTSGFQILANLYSGLKTMRKDYESFEKKGYAFHRLDLEHGEWAVTPYGIKNILDAVESVLTDIIKNEFVIRPETHEQRVELIRRVATISANNNPDIGNLIADIVAEYSEGTADEIFIDVEKSDGEATEVHQKRGFQFGAGFTHFSMINVIEGTHVEYEKPNFLLINGPLTDNDLPTIKAVAEAVCLKNDQPLVIIASEFTNGVNNQFFGWRTGQKALNQATGKEVIVRLKIVGITMEMLSPEAQERLRDLEVAIGAKALATQQGKIIDFDAVADIGLVLGHAERIKSQPNLTSIFGGKGAAKEIEVRVAELREARQKYALSDSPSDHFNLSKLDRRIGMLRSNMASIKVGGRTYKEKEYVHDLYVDAVAASMSVLRHGATLGGNLTVVSAIRKTEDLVDRIVNSLRDTKKVVVFGNNEKKTREAVQTVLKVIEFAFKTSYYQVVLNAVQDEEEAWEIFQSVDEVLDDCPAVINLLTGEFEYLRKDDSLAGVNSKLLVAGNTDIALMEAVFTVVSTFLMANQLLDVQFN